MVQRIPDDKLTQLGNDIPRLHILDVASMRIYTDGQSIVFIPKITYTPEEFKNVVEEATAGKDYYGQDKIANAAWICNPDDLTEDQLKLEYALLLAIWERVDLTMTYGDNGWKYAIGNEPNYYPIYKPAKKLWDALHTPTTQDTDDGETHIEEINGRVYVRKGDHEDGYSSWADALNAIIDKQDERPTDGEVGTLNQLYCKVSEYGWDNVGTWRIKGDHPRLVFTPASTLKITGKDLELANKILKHGVGVGEFSNIVLNTVFYKVPCVLLKGPRNNLIRRVIAGMFIALAENSEMYIRHCCGQWKISLDTHTPEAYINLYNISQIC